MFVDLIKADEFVYLSLNPETLIRGTLKFTCNHALKNR